MSANEFSAWYHSIPPVTRYWFTAAIIVPIASRFGIISPTTLYLSYDEIFFHFQLWRVITCLLWMRVSFNYLMNLYFLYSYSSRLESGVFAGRTADYAYMLLVMSGVLVLVGMLLSIPFLFESMVLAALYVWCQLNRDVVVQFWFGLQFKAVYLPWVLAAFNFVLAGEFMAEFLGIVAGHLYYFLKFTYPQDHGGPRLLETPEFFAKWFGPPARGGFSGFGVPPARPRAVDEDVRQRNENDAGHRWGRGNQLGGR